MNKAPPRYFDSLLEVVGRVLVHLETVLSNTALGTFVVGWELVERRASLIVDVAAIDADHRL